MDVSSPGAPYLDVQLDGPFVLRLAQESSKRPIKVFERRIECNTDW